MSSILKKGEKGGSAQTGQQNAGGSAKPKKGEGKSTEVKLRPNLIVPELPGHLKKILNDKDRPVKSLEAIVVVFYPNNLQEVRYRCKTSDGEEDYTVTQFMKLQEQVVQQRRAEHEKQGYEGLGKKLRKRLLIDILDEISVDEGRRISALDYPPTAKKVLGLSQKEFFEKFKNDEAIVGFWEEIPETAKAAMQSLQNSINPKGIDWKESLRHARNKIRDEELAQAARQAEKLKRKAELASAASRAKAQVQLAEATSTKTSWGDEEEETLEKELRERALKLVAEIPSEKTDLIPMTMMGALGRYKARDLKDVILELEKLKRGEASAFDQAKPSQKGNGSEEEGEDPATSNET